jgi:hypothetical protein
LEASLKLDPESLEFTAEFEWIPVIEVEESQSWHDEHQVGTAFIGFSTERYYIAKRPDKLFVRADWRIFHHSKEDARYYGKPPIYHAKRFYDRNILNDDGTLEGDFPLPFVSDMTRRHYYLPYSEETWGGIQQIIEAIKVLKSRLHEVLGTDEGRKLLLRVGESIIKALPKPNTRDLTGIRFMTDGIENEVTGPCEHCPGMWWHQAVKKKDRTGLWAISGSDILKNEVTK